MTEEEKKKKTTEILHQIEDILNKETHDVYKDLKAIEKLHEEARKNGLI